MELSESIQNQSPQVKSWIPLKPGPNLQRPTQDFTKLPNRPTKAIPFSQTPARSPSKGNFYVDENLAVLEPDSAHRASRSVPKFPIRRRSASQSSSAPEKPTPPPRLASNPILLCSLEELKPIEKTEKWKTPKKGSFHTPAQSVRKVCFRTPSMETPENDSIALRSLRKSFSILTLATPAPIPTPEFSTTPLDPPECPSSPKIFDLSDADDSFQLFTPRKPKASSTPTVANTDQNTHVALDEQEAEILPIAGTMERAQNDDHLALVPLIHPRADDPLPAVPSTPNCNTRPSGNQRDFSVPLKPAHLETSMVSPKPQNAPLSVKSYRSEKDTPGILSGVIAFVDVKTADGDDASAPFVESLKSLGAKVVKQWAWNGEELDKVGITHVIFKQGGPRTLSKVKMAKGSVKCVGLGWVARFFTFFKFGLKARSEAINERVDETPYQVEIPTGNYGHKVLILSFWNG